MQGFFEFEIVVASVPQSNKPNPVAGSDWGWSCRNGMGRGSLRVTGAGAAEMAWEEATEGERGLSGR